MSRLDVLLASYLDDLDTRHRFRRLHELRPAGPGRVRRAGRLLINFSSNDYLGLASHPALIERAQEWAASWGAGATASRLICGTLEIHERVEAKIAVFKQVEAALVFASGFQANATVLPALLDRLVLRAEPVVFADALIHASMHHGCRAAKVRPQLYRHNDLAHLNELLAANADRPGPRFILTESVFSMDGDRSNVPALADLAERHNAFLYLDEAHATGVLGPGGAGLAALAPGRVDLVMGTFSKALGGFGAYVAGSNILRDYLINRCGGFIYSTALPPAMLGAIDAALDLVPSMDKEREILRDMAQRLRDLLNAEGLDTGFSTTQIVPVLIGDDAAAVTLGQSLEDAGFLGAAIRPPTVRPGSSRMRFALSAAHRMEDVESLAAAVVRASRQSAPANTPANTIAAAP